MPGDVEKRHLGGQLEAEQLRRHLGLPRAFPAAPKSPDECFAGGGGGWGRGGGGGDHPPLLGWADSTIGWRPGANLFYIWEGLRQKAKGTTEMLKASVSDF